MKDDSEILHEQAAIQRTVRYLEGFAKALGVNETGLQQLVERAAADMIYFTDEELLIDVRARIISATRSKMPAGRSIH